MTKEKIDRLSGLLGIEVSLLEEALAEVGEVSKLDLGPWVNDWANFRAVDSDGSLYEYDSDPEDRNSAWGRYDGYVRYDGIQYIKTIDLQGIDWRTTKEER